MDFSFSGVKTAVATFLASEDGRAERPEDLAASFQEAVVEMLVKPTIAAARELGADTIALTGGVAANSRLRDCAGRGSGGRRAAAGRTRAEILHRQRGDDRAGGKLPPAARRARRLERRRRSQSGALNSADDDRTKIARSLTETPSRPASALARAGVRPAKSRGQNFLTSAGVANRIVAAAELSESDAVIEIGPGLGILTEKIAPMPHRSLTLVELDARLAARLQERFADVRVVNADFLTIDFAALAAGSSGQGNRQSTVQRRGGYSASAMRQLAHDFANGADVSARGRRANSRAARRRRVRRAQRVHRAVLANRSRISPSRPAASIRAPRLTLKFSRLRRLRRRVSRRLTSARCSRPCAPSFSAPRKTIRNALSHALGLDSLRNSARARARCDRSRHSRRERSACRIFCDSRTHCASNWPAWLSHAMPELPEVESLRRILVRTAVGRTIVKARIGEKRLRRRVTANFGRRSCRHDES